VVASGTNWTAVEDAVAEASALGTVGVAIEGPGTARWSHHGDRTFGAASTVKIPIMIEIFRQIDVGTRSLDDPYTVTAEDHTPGSGVLLHLHTGIELTLNDLIYLMISISDNMATNILIRMAGMDAVNRTMADIGMTNSVLGREMKGRPAQAGERENLATANDYARAIRAIIDGTAASRASPPGSREHPLGIENRFHCRRDQRRWLHHRAERHARDRRLLRELPRSARRRGSNWGHQSRGDGGNRRRRAALYELRAGFSVIESIR